MPQLCARKVAVELDVAQLVLIDEALELLRARAVPDEHEEHPGILFCEDPCCF